MNEEDQYSRSEFYYSEDQASAKVERPVGRPYTIL